jgi:hypothetical protein
VPTSSSRVCSVSHLRCPESAGNFSHQPIRRHRAAAPDFSHRFRTPQIRKRDVCRHHHRAFARSAICGAPNLREISATSARADSAPPFRISPTDSGLRRLEKEIYGSSLFPMGEQTKPILSFGGIDRSWASSRDESLRERLRLIVSARGFLGPAHLRQVIAVCDQQTPALTPETISRRAAPTFRHVAKLISGFLL